MKIGFILVLVCVLMVSGCGKGRSQTSGGLGDAADFTLETTGGEKVILSEELKSKDVVLVFFATWCPYCIEEIPAVNDFYAKNKDTIAVFGVNIQESKAKVANLIKKKGITYPVALDSDGSVAGAYGVRGIPTIVAVSKEGKVLYKGHSIEEMQEKVTF